ncbi:DUF3551 domain-containing protein [Bradyrhizobium sp. LHD-71]|uniref:DUF3551 domain-containing protein n=1 Tax=Bradyrhizobium sp. LHD-71 TaxID=3072141 RepID=UPI00280DC22F|nr:DUF3551 domain-containing protein [Bradyrhizobium sp. LHD-71]MDQ8730772.1 DUF3551 domain-containing protein [Bradyrhizobium sp. LHD-71]
MRVLTFAAVLAGSAWIAAPTTTPANAQGFEYPYCTSGGWATDNICRFYTFEQCLTFVQGVGGSCTRNPRVAAQYPYDQDSQGIPGPRKPHRR